MFNELDPILHAQSRLAIISLLVSLESAEFVFLKEKTMLTAGNLSLQLDKLKSAGYITITKSFKGKYPVTVCAVTPAGKAAFATYVENLKTYISSGAG